MTRVRDGSRPQAPKPAVVTRAGEATVLEIAADGTRYYGNGIYAAPGTQVSPEELALFTGGGPAAELPPGFSEALNPTADGVTTFISPSTQLPEGVELKTVQFPAPVQVPGGPPSPPDSEVRSIEDFLPGKADVVSKGPATYRSAD